MAHETKESRVRVGVRIRPLTSKEINQGGKNSLVVSPPSVKLAQRQFTYDTVFDAHMGQSELYDNVAGPLLKSFSDGYNATIMAYGQTGSGKTFTMGSEAHTKPESSSHVGLIPRFIADFFHQIRQKKESSDQAVGDSPTLLDYHVTASFLEVYGEDVYDLLDADRKSLPLREDSAGGVVIAGLTHRSVSNPNETLQVLHEGTMNRTTAATLMNLTSSRSHAVFTIHLTQVVRSEKCEDVDITSNSKFTFVDLAGSERMKKTGAEGERAREGIKINEGLLALGNVINALADDGRIAKEKKVHVPYRQSKLTRLLQDALGGNSLTLFLACVSPSDTNASETLSTLHYANRARNIRNAPTQNVDATALELQRLHTLAHVLQCELIKYRFPETAQRNENIGYIDSTLMERSDVEEYIRLIHQTVAKTSQIEDPVASVASVSFSLKQSTASGKPRYLGGSQQTHVLDSTPNKTLSERFDDSFLGEVNPDEDMAILDQLLELQQHDQEYDKERKMDDERLRFVNGELEKEEAMLLKIRGSLKVYHSLKKKYEELMAEVQQLELEKASLAEQLEKAKADPSIGCSAAIKKQMEKVELSLSRARKETRNHRQKYKIADEQAKKSRTLERKIDELKHAKRALVKKQKEDLARYKETTDLKTKELLMLKRKEKVAGRKMSKLENEIQHHKNTLDKRQKYCTKLSMKLKQTESHLLRLLTLRQRDLAKRTNTVGSHQRMGVGVASSSIHAPQAHAEQNQEWKSTRFVLNKMVWDKVNQAYLQNLYEERIAIYSDTMRKVMAKAKRLKEVRSNRKERNSDSIVETVQDLEDSIAELELKLELLGTELKDIRARMPEETKKSVEDREEAVSRLMNTMSSNTLKAMLLETFSKLVEAETKRKTLTESVDRKDAALLSFESEVEGLSNKVSSLSKDLIDRRLVSDSGSDPYELLREMKKKNSELAEKLHVAETKFQTTSSLVSEMKRALKQSQLKNAKTREILAFAEASLSKQGETVESAEVLEQMQKIWEELGVESSFREKERQEIQSSLSDTCAKKLDNAIAIKKDTESEIGLLRKRLEMMNGALGISMEPHEHSDVKEPLLQILQELRKDCVRVATPYRYACARREKILNDALTLSDALAISTETLSSSLRALLDQNESEEERGKSSDNMDDDISNSSTNSGRQMDTLHKNATSDNQVNQEILILPPRSLESGFLSACENDIKSLRVKKSELLVKNREIGQDIAETLLELHMSAEDLVARMDHILSNEYVLVQERWDRRKAETILRDIMASNSVVDVHASDSQQLEMIHQSVENIAKDRRSLTSLLQKIVESAQKTLLNIVGREVDASEAYASFHDALFRLPSLSRDLSLACISEMEALVLCVEAMTQSETEALTVVWGALNISAEERRDFWARVQAPKSREVLSSSLLNDFGKCVGPGREAWISEAVSKAKTVHQELEWKLCKLSGIHSEVESLRSKQDTKSQILSLDSEIRVLSSNLRDFEEQKCNRRRLLIKKSSGSKLLKEERFRKQMKSKLVSKLSQLADLLRSWQRKEGRPFDASVLSDDVQMLVKDPTRMENWMENRTQHMPSRTGQEHLPARKRQLQDASSGRSTFARPKARAPTYPQSSSSLKESEISGGKYPQEGNTNCKDKLAPTRKLAATKRHSSKGLNENMKRNREESTEKNPNTVIDRIAKRKSRKRENMSLLPFGRILSDAASPDVSSKENI